MIVTPWSERRWPIDPALHFGIEFVDADDEEDRGPAFVSGAGIRRDAGSRWTLHATLLHHYLTVEDDPVDGVETGHDATLWEARLAIGWRSGAR